MAAAEVARRPIEQGAQPGVRPLSEYPGPQANIVGSVNFRDDNGRWGKNYYYDGPVPGAEPVIGYTGREWKVTQSNTPRIIEVFHVSPKTTLRAVKP